MLRRQQTIGVRRCLLWLAFGFLGWDVRANFCTKAATTRSSLDGPTIKVCANSLYLQFQVSQLVFYPQVWPHQSPKTTQASRALRLARVATRLSTSKLLARTCRSLASSSSSTVQGSAQLKQHQDQSYKSAGNTGESDALSKARAANRVADLDCLARSARLKSIRAEAKFFC